VSSDPIKITDLLHLLIEGTKKGAIKWEPESTEGDVFRAKLDSGSVRVSRVVAFSPSTAGSSYIVGGSPLLFELLNADGRSLFPYRPMTTEDHPLVEELFNLAREQALDLDKTIDALVEEIRSRAGAAGKP